VASTIRLDDTDWSEHIICDGHRMIPLRVSGHRLRIQECMAFVVLISDATCQAHPTPPQGFKPSWKSVKVLRIKLKV
jgi:hypothetical protein